MDVNGLQNTGYVNNQYEKKYTGTKNKKTSEKAATDKEQAAVYEASNKSDTKKATYTRDTATVNRLKLDVENRHNQLQSIVEKLLTRQGETYNNSTDIYKLLRSGNLKVDAETAAKAKADIAEDGYWGINQTSDRMVEMAKALSGGDTSKADKLINAVKKGFDQATKTWGDKLPDICQKTIDATIEKLEAWRDTTAITE